MSAKAWCRNQKKSCSKYTFICISDTHLGNFFLYKPFFLYCVCLTDYTVSRAYANIFDKQIIIHLIKRFSKGILKEGLVKERHKEIETSWIRYV